MTITGKEVLDALPGKGGVPFASDRVKTPLAWRDVIKLERAYMKWLWDADQYVYNSKSRDCDWFVAQYIAYMDRVSAEKGIPSYAVAEVWYEPEVSMSLHAVAVWMTPAGKLLWRETRPKCRKLRLSLGERRSVCFRRV